MFIFYGANVREKVEKTIAPFVMATIISEALLKHENQIKYNVWCIFVLYYSHTGKKLADGIRLRNS